MSWRPENWEEVKEQARRPDLFEAGADAMLKGLIEKHGVRRTEATLMVTQPMNTALERGHGYLVFIPDEEVRDEQIERSHCES